MALAFDFKSRKGGIHSEVLSDSEMPKNIPRYDVVWLRAFGSDGKLQINTYMTPHEAAIIAAALMSAYALATHKGKERIGPCRRRS